MNFREIGNSAMRGAGRRVGEKSDLGTKNRGGTLGSIDWGTMSILKSMLEFMMRCPLEGNRFVQMAIE